MSLLALILTTTLTFLGVFSLISLLTACRRLPRREAELQLQKMGKFFLYGKLHTALFSEKSFEGLLFVVRCTISLLQFAFALSVFLWLWYATLLSPVFDQFSVMRLSFTLFLVIVPFFFLGDFFPRFLGMRYPALALKLSAPISSFYLLLASPLCAGFLKILQKLLKASHFEHFTGGAHDLPPEILQFVQEATDFPRLEAHDKKIFESVTGFRKRIAREVMVPRIDMFSLPGDTPIRLAGKRLEEEGYSRTPVYGNGIDDIIGVLMWKDIQKKYMESIEKNDPRLLDAPIKTIVKNVLYTPETKPISNLLQEFRQKQVHLAIVVDEYGGTEGIVTIEDILEQLVGEISDEYDDREALFTKHPHGGWVVDPRMSLLDLEEKVGIKIPQDGDYDTVAGYIFYCAGAIPARGFVIHRDTFELEILNSNERLVEQVRIKPVGVLNEDEVAHPSSG